MKFLLQCLLFVLISSCTSAGSKLSHEFYSLYPDGEYKEYFISLSNSDALRLAHEIKNHKDGRVVFLAANQFIKNKMLDDAIPLVASLYATGRNKTDLGGRMEYGWAHAFSPEYKKTFSNKLIEYFISQMNTYTKEELIRIANLIEKSKKSKIIYQHELSLIKKTIGR